MKDLIVMSMAICLVSLSLFLMITSLPKGGRDSEGGRKITKKLLP